MGLHMQRDRVVEVSMAGYDIVVVGAASAAQPLGRAWPRGAIACSFSSARDGLRTAFAASLCFPGALPRH